MHIIEPFKQIVDDGKTFGTVMIQQRYHVGRKLGLKL
jgi:hypothetical protein